MNHLGPWEFGHVIIFLPYKQLTWLSLNSFKNLSLLNLLLAALLSYN